MKKTSRLVPLIVGTFFTAVFCVIPPATAQNAGSVDTQRPIVAADQPAHNDAQSPQPRASAALDVTVAEIMANPDAYAGRYVTVTSAVEEVLTPWTARLDEDRPLAGGVDNDLLLVGTLPLVSFGFDPSWVNKEVRATGTVRVLQAADFIREFGRGMDNDLFSRFEGKPALIVTSMTIAGQPASQSSGSSGASGASGAAGSGAAGGPDSSGTTASSTGTAGQTGAAMDCTSSSVLCPPNEPVWAVVPADSVAR